MKAKIKSDPNKVLHPFCEKGWDLKDKKQIVILLMHKWTFIRHKQEDNMLKIYTLKGNAEIRFSGEIPLLEFDHQEKDEVVFNIVNYES